MGASLGCASEPGTDLVPSSAVRTKLRLLKLPDPEPNDVVVDVENAHPNDRAANRGKKRLLSTLLETPSKARALRAKRRMVHEEALGPRIQEWSELVVPKRDEQDVFYYETHEKRLQRAKPEGFDAGVELTPLLPDDEARLAPPKKIAPSAPIVVDENDSSEDGAYWIRIEDNKNRAYFYDLVSKETRWERPKGYSSPKTSRKTTKSASARKLRDSVRFSLTKA